MVKTKVLIVEDEALIADNLAAILVDLNYEVTDICANADEALKSIKNNVPEICLLDVNIDGEIDGIDLAGFIQKKLQVPHIFITSFSDAETIERAKQTLPAAYIIKPYTEKEVEVNMTLALHKKSEPLSQLKPKTEAEEDSFFIKDKHELIKIKFDDISYCEAADNYTIIYTSKNKYMLSQTMKTVFEKLEASGFIRVHRSYFVRFKDIQSIGPNYIIIQGKEIALSQNHRSELLARINLI
jgi:DNA-binding LytR/AlgR family response regulator